MEEIRKQWVKAYDFVLLISEKGFTDGASVCTIQLADLIILMIDMSDYGLKKSIEFARQVNIPGIREDGRPAMILPVPSRVHRSELNRVLEFKSMMIRNIFSQYLPPSIDADDYFNNVYISEFSRYSYVHEIPVIYEPPLDRNTISHEYRILSKYIVDIQHT
ncbi:MAG: hypothetical protein U1F76_13945 [Candidatus Competibacteraceae bacterium]